MTYTHQFGDIEGSQYILTITTPEGSGTSTLLLSGEPITIDYNLDKDIFKPLKLSGCSINVLTPDVMPDLYTSKQIDVTIEITKDGNPFWYGFNTPNVYDQDYQRRYDKMTIEAVDTISALENFKYTYIDGEDATSSFYDIIWHCFESIGTPIQQIRLGGNQDLLNSLYIRESNFFDEDGEAISCRRVIEYILQFLGLQMCQWENYYYIYDIYQQHINYLTYRPNINIPISGTTTPTILNGIVAENVATISMNNIYNKIRVVANILDEEDDLNLTTPTDEHLVAMTDMAIGDMVSKGANHLNEPNDDAPEAKKIVSGIYNRDDATLSVPTISNYSFKTLGEWNLTGAFYQRVASQEPENIFDVAGHYRPMYRPQPDISFDTYLTCKIGSVYQTDNYVVDPVLKDSIISNTNFNASEGTQLFNINLGQKHYPQGDYLILSGRSLLSSCISPEFPLYYDIQADPNYMDDQAELYAPYGGYYILNHGLQLKYRSDNLIYYCGYLGIQAKLRFGNKYFTGSGWSTTEQTFAMTFEVRFGSLNNVEFSMVNNNSYTNKITSTSEGLVIQLDSEMQGDIEFTVYDKIWDAVTWLGPMQAMRRSWITTNDERGAYSIDDLPFYYFHLRDITLSHATKEQESWDLNIEDNQDADLIYSNIIADDNVVELGDITLYVNTFNSEQYKGSSKSYVVDDTGNFVTELTLFDGQNYVTQRPEETIVARYYNHFSQKKYIYYNCLRTNAATPFSVIHIQSLVKNLRVGSVTYDLKFNRMNVTLNEI